MNLNHQFRCNAFHAYIAQVRQRFGVKRAELDRYALMHEWDSVRYAAIDLAAIAQVLRDAENKLADIE